MKTKIQDFLRRTLKATGALLMAATAVASAAFIPEPWNGYAATAVVILTWVVTYAIPFFQKVVEGSPMPDSPVTGEVVEPPTEVIPMQVAPTVGIPVIEGADSGDRPEPGPTVDDILDRLRREGDPSVV